MGQWVRAFVLQAEAWVFGSHPRQVVKTGSDSSTAKLSAIDVSVTAHIGDDHFKRMSRITEGVAR